MFHYFTTTRLRFTFDVDMPTFSGWSRCEPKYTVRVTSALFADHVAVVTGGALGIGGGISRRLAAAGARGAADIDADAPESTRDAIVEAGGLCTIVIGDIRDRHVVTQVTESALAVADSRVDILVNNVGDFRPASATALRCCAGTSSPHLGKVFAICMKVSLTRTPRPSRSPTPQGGRRFHDQGEGWNSCEWRYLTGAIGYAA